MDQGKGNKTIINLYSTLSPTLTLKLNTTTCQSKIVMRQTIRLPLTALKQCLSTKLVLSALQLRLIKVVLRNSNLSKCGNHLTERLETFLMEPFSVKQLLLIISQDLSQDGLSLSSLVDMLMEINIVAKTMLYKRLVKLK